LNGAGAATVSFTHMGKKKKKTTAVESAPTGSEAARVDGGGGGDWLAELRRHPSLLMAVTFGALTLLSAVMCIKHHDNHDMGAIREPTGVIMWAAITATFLASYFRESRRAAKTDS